MAMVLVYLVFGLGPQGTRALDDWILWTAGVVLALGAIYAAVSRISRRVRAWYHKWDRLRDGILLLVYGRDEIRAPEDRDVVLSEALPSALDRLSWLKEAAQQNTRGIEFLIGELRDTKSQMSGIAEDVATVRAEVTYNHGTSLKDAVRRIDTRVAKHLGDGGSTDD